MKLVKKFGKYRVNLDPMEHEGVFKLTLSLKDVVVLQADLVCCKKHTEEVLLQFVGKYLTAFVEKVKIDRKILMEAIKDAEEALEEMKL